MLYGGATAGIYRTRDGGGQPRCQQPGAHFEDWRPSEGSDNSTVSPSRVRFGGEKRDGGTVHQGANGMRDGDPRGSVVHDPGKRSWEAHCARCGAKELIGVGRPSADTFKEIPRVLEDRGWMELEHGRSNDFLSGGWHCPDCSRAVRN